MHEWGYGGMELNSWLTCIKGPMVTATIHLPIGWKLAHFLVFSLLTPQRPFHIHIPQIHESLFFSQHRTSSITFALLLFAIFFHVQACKNEHKELHYSHIWYAYIHACEGARAHTHTCMHNVKKFIMRMYVMHTYIHPYTHTYIYIHIHILSHTHTHIHTKHTYIQTNSARVASRHLDHFRLEKEKII